MIYSKLRKVGNSYVVTIPREEIERLSLKEGQMLAVDAHPVEIRPALPDDLREIFDETWRRNEAGYRYLADR